MRGVESSRLKTSRRTVSLESELTKDLFVRGGFASSEFGLGCGKGGFIVCICDFVIAGRRLESQPK